MQVQTNPCLLPGKKSLLLIDKKKSVVFFFKVNVYMSPETILYLDLKEKTAGFCDNKVHKHVVAYCLTGS